MMSRHFPDKNINNLAVRGITNMSYTPPFFLIPQIFISTLRGSEGTQWPSDRVIDSKSRGCGFEPNWHHCIVSLSKTH